VDNVLSHHVVHGVVSERQGVEREISDLGIRTLELIRIASHELGASIPRSVEIAREIVTNPDACFRTPSGAELRFSLDSIDRRLRDRLMDAIEATPRLKRGRPRRSG
jgi:hypothetical protein